MPHYMIQGAYTAEAWATQLKNPQDRAEAVRGVIEGLGGKVVNAFLAFGEYDFVLICEMSDNVSAGAFSMALAAGGAAKSAKTTVLMTVDEATTAMKRAAGSGYTPPGG